MFHTHEKAQEMTRRILKAWKETGCVSVLDESRALRLGADVLFKWFIRHRQASEIAEREVRKHQRADARKRELLFRKYYREALEDLSSL